MILYRKEDRQPPQMWPIDPMAYVLRSFVKTVDGFKSVPRKSAEAFQAVPREPKAWHWNGTCAQKNDKWARFGTGYSAYAHTEGEAKALIEALKEAEWEADHVRND